MMKKSITNTLILMLIIATPVFSRGSNDVRCPFNIRSIAYSQNSAFIATGLDRGGVKIWDISNKTDIFLGGYTGENAVSYGTIEKVSFSPDGNYLASFGSSDIKIWYGRKWGQERILERPRIYKNMSSRDAVHWDMENRQIICIGGGFMVRWDIDTGRIVDISSGEQFGMYFGPILAINPDGSQFARSNILNENYDILLWNIAENRQEGIFTGYRGIVNMEYSPDGNYILTIESISEIVSGKLQIFGGIIRLWDTRSLSEVYNIEINIDGSSIYSANFCPDGKYFIAKLHDRLMLFDTATGNEKSIYNNPLPNGRNFTNVVFSPDGNLMAIGIDHDLRIWNISTGEYMDILASEREDVCYHELYGK
jgi:WD40 repeat protein